MYSTLILCVALWVVFSVLSLVAIDAVSDARFSRDEARLKREKQRYATWQCCKFGCFCVFYVVAVVKSLILVN